MILFAAFIVTIVLMFAPLAAAFRVALFYALTIYIIMWWEPSSRHEGVNHTLGMLFLGLILFAQFSLIIIRVVVREFRAKGVVELSTYPTSPIFFFIDLLFACSLGGLIGAKIFIAIAWALSTGDGGFNAHYLVTLIGFTLFSGTLWLLVVMFKKHGQSRSILIVSVFAAIFFFLAILSALGSFYPEYVVGNAAKIARDDPYCINLGKRRTTAKALEELTFFTMDKQRHNYHATLTVDRGGKRLQHYWSYRYGRFIKDKFTTQRQCSPIHHFGEKLTKYSSSDSSASKEGPAKIATMR
jgi:hypothetical protein